MAAARNSLIDPQPGDSVISADGKRQRDVVDCRGGNIIYLINGRRMQCWISTWMEWCRRNKARVVAIGCRRCYAAIPFHDDCDAICHQCLDEAMSAADEMLAQLNEG